MAEYGKKTLRFLASMWKAKSDKIIVTCIMPAARFKEEVVNLMQDCENADNPDIIIKVLIANKGKADAWLVAEPAPIRGESKPKEESSASDGFFKAPAKGPGW